ncbi:MAG: cupin domain-containing protein [Bacillota bacterium]
MLNTNIDTLYFEESGSIPNNPDLPVLFYRGVLKDKPNDIERIFNEHNWRNSWQGGVFDYHHFHSNTHEVLGVVSGSAELIIGGESGETMEVKPGDVLVLPAGTGHKRLNSTEDFQVAGAYPNGKDHNLKTDENNERTQLLIEIKEVDLPSQDPVHGESGPLLSLWKQEE